MAGGLAARGVHRGDVVTWQLPNWYEAVVLFRACWRLGAVAAPLHHRSGAQEIREQLARLEPKVVLAAPGLAASAVSGAIEVRNGDDDLFDHAPVDGGSARLDDPAVVLFTSGSVGRPKGVVHTHRSLSYKASTMPRVHGLDAADVVLMPAPLAHVSGLLNGVLVPGAVGMKVVLMERWDPAVALRLIAAEGVSFMVGPPTFFVGLLEAPSFAPELVATLRVVSCGGAGVTRSFVEESSARLGARVKRSYGSTEAPTVTTWHDGDPPTLAASSDGRAVGDVELRIAAQTGELWVRGREVFAGYLGVDPADTFTPDGWFRTGDLAVLDRAGWLTLVGRCRDVIIRGGENIAPAEVEAVLEDHPSIQQAVAVGLLDDRLGEVVGAAIVADDAVDLAECRGWFAEQGVADFKSPAQVLRVDGLPLLASGKPDREAVRELLMVAAGGRGAA